MPKLRAFLTLIVALSLSGSVFAASNAKKTGTPGAGRTSIVSDHVPQIDGPMTMATSPSGHALAAWAYRDSGEFDIAVSSRESAAAAWSAPAFFGRRNGADETEPTIAFGADGTGYLAFSMADPPRVALAVLPAGAAAWSEPVIVSGAIAASSPSLLVVRDRVVVGYRTPRGVGMVDFPATGASYGTDGIQDGPDGIDPLGVKKGTDNGPHSDVTVTLPPPDEKP